MKHIQTNFSRCKGGILAALALCFIAVVYGPLELYFTNREDFWFAPDVILPDVIFLFLAAFVLCAMLLLLAQKFSQRLYEILTACFVWGTLVCYIHSNFLSGWLPSMDGTAIDWNAYPTQRLLSIAVCAAVLVLVVVFAKMKWLQKAALWGGAVLSLMLLVTVTTLGIGSTSTLGSYYTATTEGLQSYSTDKNFVIFVVDSVDGDVFENLMEANPEYQESLRDFTYYRNSLSAYPYTHYAVPQLLTGQWYEGSEAFEQFRSKAVKRAPLFQTLGEQNYKMGIYFTENLVDKNAEPERFFNMKWEAPAIVSHPALWRVILRMSCVKNAPFDFKRLGYSLPDKLNQLKLIDKQQADSAFTVSDRDFLQSCQTADICPERMFKYIHVEGAHTPLQYGPHLENVANTPQATYENQVAGTIYLIQNYLEMLRKNSTYDNTAVIIMSDHGYVDAEREDPALKAQGRQNIQRAHSIFLAKGFEESHDYAVSDAALSYDDLQQVYAKLLSGSTGENLVEADQNRQRRFLNYRQEDLASGFEEMIQSGEADDITSFKPTGTVYMLPKNLWS